MKPETKRRLKLWLRKRALMALRAVVWAVDDWLHRQEVRLREDLAESKPKPFNSRSSAPRRRGVSAAEFDRKILKMRGVL